MERVFAAGDISAVMHFAGLKAVGESVEKPLLYWDNNVYGTLVLSQAMERHGVRTLVFSSSCTVYGDPASVPIREDAPVSQSDDHILLKSFLYIRAFSISQAHPASEDASAP